MSSSGIFFCVTGPRGAGKGSLIQGARRQLADNPSFVFPRRIITLPDSTADGVVHQAVTPAQFEGLRRDGAFCLHWKEGGISYAIPASVELDLKAGRSVVANVAPQVVAAAKRRFGRVAVVEVRAPGRVLAARLARRDLAPRGDGELPFGEGVLWDADYVIENDGLLSTAIARFVDVLCKRTVPSAPREPVTLPLRPTPL